MQQQYDDILSSDAMEEKAQDLSPKIVAAQQTQDKEAVKAAAEMAATQKKATEDEDKMIMDTASKFHI